MRWPKLSPYVALCLTPSSYYIFISTSHRITPGNSAQWHLMWGRGSLTCFTLGVMGQSQRQPDAGWRYLLEIWMKICAWITIALDLTRVSEPIPYLKMVSDIIFVGVMSLNEAGVKKRTVEGYLRNKAQILSAMEVNYQFIDHLGLTSFCLIQQLCTYKCANPLPNHV